MAESGHAGCETSPQGVGFRAADDHELGAAPLTVVPGPIEITVDQHVHRLEHIGPPE